MCPWAAATSRKSLTKEMKLTFAKAEHLKRNATTAQDPKAVFQAMRPVFNDLQTELQRSLGFFTNLDRTAKIGRVVAMGNAFKLPGLQKFLAQGLGFTIERVERFRGLVGPEVLATPAFKDNILSFGVCYGLCLQALQTGGLKTNLLPKEISMDRLIRRKKPWAVAAAAIVMLACTVSYAAYALQCHAVTTKDWDPVVKGAKDAEGMSTRLKGEYEAAKTKYKTTKDKGDRLVNNVGNRSRWLEFLTALNTCLPPYPVNGKIPVQKMPDATNEDELRKQIMTREQLFITNIDSQPVDDASKWFTLVKPWYRSIPGQPGAPPMGDSGEAPAAGGAPANAAPVTGAAGSGGAAAAGDGPTGPGIIVQVYGRHFHNAREDKSQGTQYVYDTLLTKLASKEMHDLGVSYPVIVQPLPNDHEEIIIPSPKRSGAEANKMGTIGGPTGPGLGHGGLNMPLGLGGGAEAETGDKKITAERTHFRVQFIWQPKSTGETAAAAAAGGTTGAAAPAATAPPAAGNH